MGVSFRCFLERGHFGAMIALIDTTGINQGLIKLYYLRNLDFCNFSSAFLFSFPSFKHSPNVSSCCLQGSTHPLPSCLFQVPQRSLRAAIFSESVSFSAV